MQAAKPAPRRKHRYYILVFLAPAVMVYTVFMIIPLIDSLRLSFFTITAENKEVFNGFNNYVTLLTDPQFAPAFVNALGNNIKFFIVHMVVQNSIGLLLAALLASPGRGRGVYRTLIFMPTVLSVVIIGFIWQLILNPLWGVSEGILKAIGLGALYKPWLGLEPSALLTLSLISVWQFVGIPMLLFYVALIGIPEELIEAARVDGYRRLGHFLAREVPADSTDCGHRGHPDLCWQFQRLRFNLHRQRRAGRGWVRSLEFRTKEDEYRYELDRNDTLAC